MFKTFSSLTRRQKTDCFYCAFGLLVFFAPILEGLSGVALAIGVIGAMAFNVLAAAHYYSYKSRIAEESECGTGCDALDEGAVCQLGFSGGKSFGARDIDVNFHDFSALSTRDI